MERPVYFVDIVTRRVSSGPSSAIVLKLPPDLSLDVLKTEYGRIQPTVALAINPRAPDREHQRLRYTNEVKRRATASPEYLTLGDTRSLDRVLVASGKYDDLGRQILHPVQVHQP